MSHATTFTITSRKQRFIDLTQELMQPAEAPEPPPVPVAPPPVAQAAPPPQPPRFSNGVPFASARALKATIVLDPSFVSSLQVKDGVPRIAIAVAVAGRTVSIGLNAKSVRKGKATIAEYGPDGVACVIQGRLEADDTLADAGLQVLPKAPKPPVGADALLAPARETA